MRKWISLMCAAGIAAAALMGCSGAEDSWKERNKSGRRSCGWGVSRKSEQ